MAWGQIDASAALGGLGFLIIGALVSVGMWRWFARRSWIERVARSQNWGSARQRWALRRWWEGDDRPRTSESIWWEDEMNRQVWQTRLFGAFVVATMLVLGVGLIVSSLDGAA